MKYGLEFTQGVNSFPLHLFGDPTLRMRKLANHTDINIYPEKINLGNINCNYDPHSRDDCPPACLKNFEINISNVGNEEAEIYIMLASGGQTSLYDAGFRNIPANSSTIIIGSTSLCGLHFNKGPIRDLVILSGNTEKIFYTIEINGQVI